MTKMIMHGCNGAMGQVITELVKKDKEITIVAGIDLVDNKENGYPVFKDINECVTKADVIIDFASAKAIDNLLDYSSRTGIPVVFCTTGLSEIQISRIEDLSKKVAVVRSANMSLGVNLLLKIVQDAAKVLAAADFDIEIVEKHHNQKLDAPSGTALAFADSINEVFEEKYTYTYDRSKVHSKRDSKEIGIHSVRGGTIVGDHDIIFAGKDEVITFNHTAYSKAIFAKGAIQAAKFLDNRDVGLYTMSDVVE